MKTKYLTSIPSLIGIMLIPLVMVFCQPVQENGARIESDDGKHVAIEADITHKFNVKHKSTGSIDYSTYHLIEIEHDGCRYLIMEGYGETLAFKHKENCKNEFHEKKKATD